MLNFGIGNLSDRTHLIRLALVFFSYVVFAQIGSYLYRDIGTAPVFIWPPAGISIAAMVLWGYTMWPAIALASLAVQIMNDATLPVGLAVIVGNTLQPIVATYVLHQIGFDVMLARLRDTIAIILVSVFVPMVAPTIGILTMWMYNNSHGIPPPSFEQWRIWWFGGMMSTIILSPFLIRWVGKLRFTRARQQIIEIALSLSLVVFIDTILFFTHFTEIAGISLVFLLLIPFFWIALRVGPRFMTLALFITAVLSVAGTLWSGITAAPELGDRLMAVMLFNVFWSVIFLVLVSLQEGRKNATEDLREHILELENALQKISSDDRAKSEFIAVLAHELRNPLSPLLSSLELFKLQGFASEEKRKLADQMEGSIRTMGRLLDDLLDISRISRRKFKLHKEPSSLIDLIDRAVTATESAIKSRSHAFVIKKTATDVLIEVDPLRFEQVMVNLLNNASKFTDPGGTITLECSFEDRTLILCVRDTGVGIPSDMLRRIFEPFLQVETNQRVSAGLGVGLSLTKRLVEMHGGTIEARSKGVGHGSEFIVRLPLPDTMQLPMPLLRGLAPKMTDIAAQSKGLQGLRVLIVDDNEAAADALGKLLELRGHRVSVAFDGRSGLESVSGFNPHVAILDIGLPDMDGYKLARDIREAHGETVYLIALTGFGQGEDKLKARQVGFNQHLTKPIGLAEIEAALIKVPVIRNMPV